MNYATIKKNDIANGPGVRTSLFVSGCNHHCQNCFNEIAWDFNFGDPFTKEVADDIIESLRPAYVTGLTLLGGEPLEHVNQRGLLPFISRVRKELPQKTIWCYTGFTFDKDVLGWMANEWEETRPLLSYIDVLVDGKFVQELHDLSLRFRGSSNQRIIMVQESLKTGKIVLWPER
ncbi:MAG: anaerobic ribonucleoside-triphosphate reductase activating protein [Lachnospiraceae bacterium]|nr:anaerobic ribonucleoside-triphosphate reductase activating protein [Lachnospiraceae bacterium]